MNHEPPGFPAPDEPSPVPIIPQRLFLHEAGWRVSLKVGSERIFCYMMAPGQDYYHRLHDGEIYLHLGDERICLACAERRGLLAYEPRALREPVFPIAEFDIYLAEKGSESAFELAPRPDESTD